MRRLVADIATEMSLAAAQQGLEIAPVALYKAISDALTEAEQVLHPTTIESVTARQWAVMISHSRRNKVPVRDALLQLVLEGMDHAAMIVTKLKTTQIPISKRTRKVHLRLIK